MNTLFVGNLPYQVTEETLVEAVESYLGKKGCISKVRMGLDRETGRSRGFAYVDVADREVADTVSRLFFSLKIP